MQETTVVNVVGRASVSTTTEQDSASSVAGWASVVTTDGKVSARNAERKHRGLTFSEKMNSHAIAMIMMEVGCEVQRRRSVII